MFRDEYADATSGDENWRSLEVPAGDHYAWDEASTYVRRPPFLEGMRAEPEAGHRHRRGEGAGGAR